MRIRYYLRLIGYLFLSDVRHEELINYSRLIEDHSEYDAATIRHRISSLAWETAYHHSDIAYNVVRLMAMDGIDFNMALAMIRAQLLAGDIEYLSEDTAS